MELLSFQRNAVPILHVPVLTGLYVLHLAKVILGSYKPALEYPVLLVSVSSAIRMAVWI